MTNAKDTINYKFTTLNSLTNSFDLSNEKNSNSNSHQKSQQNYFDIFCKMNSDSCLFI